MNGDALLGQAEDAVAAAKAAGAHQAEVYLLTGASLDLDIEADRLSGANASTTRGGAVRVVRDGRVGFAYFSDPAHPAPAIEKALALSKLAPRGGYHLPDGAAAPDLPSRWDDAIAGVDETVATSLVDDLITSVKQACPDASVAGGGAGAGWSVHAVANSNDVAVWDRSTHLSIGAGLALDDGETTLNAWDAQTTHTGDVDATQLGRDLAETVMALRSPSPAASGRADVIFLPDAAEALLSAGVLPAVDGDSVGRERSVWTGSLGEQVAHEGLSLTDDPFWTGAIGASPFDGEGLPVIKTPIIADGVLETFIYDSWHAFQHGAKTTHHAVRSGFKAPPTTGAHHTVVTHKHTRSMDALIGDVDEGYLVESVLGAHTANATTGDFSVTAPNVWRIKGGSIEGASDAIAIAGNLPRLLMGLDAVSDDPKHRDGSVTPALRIRDIAVSA